VTTDTRCTSAMTPRTEREIAVVTDWSQPITALFSGGITAASVLMFLIIMLSRGSLLTKSGHDQVVQSKDERIADLETDRDQWRASSKVERERGDDLQVRVSEEVVPLLRVTNGLLESIRSVGGERNEQREIQGL
jgi:hypothetical protein